MTSYVMCFVISWTLSWSAALLRPKICHGAPFINWHSEHVSGAWAERERRNSRSALQPISVTPAPRYVPAPWPPAPLHRFLPRPLHVPLCSTRFSARSAPFSVPLTLRSHALLALTWPMCAWVDRRKAAVNCQGLWWCFDGSILVWLSANTRDWHKIGLVG